MNFTAGPRGHPTEGPRKPYQMITWIGSDGVALGGFEGAEKVAY
jgi:hypothetical protein